MTAVKPADVDAFVARPDPTRPLILVYGEDAGLVAERGAALIRASVDDVNDPFALARLEPEELSANPSRLVDEALTIPLFGGRRAVWVKIGASRFNVVPAVEALLQAPAAEARVVIEAGELRRNAPLRVLCEKARNAAVLPCYADDAKALERLIDAEMRDSGLTLTADARALLLPLIGGDRAASRNELRKLTLYAHGKKEVGVDDVIAVVSDASGLEVGDMVDAAFAGQPAAVEAELAKARSAGTAAGAILFAAQRHVAQLHKWRAAAGDNGRIDVGALMPPVHFSRRKSVEDALRAWTAERLVRAMSQLAEAALDSRRQSALADTIVQRALLSIAVNARRKGG
jgi:DNA polymerase-3 subunit delta